MPRKKQFDKEVVLKKAVELFWKKGYHGTSIQDLVSHLGINRASLYDTYGGKWDLYLQAVQQYRQESSSGMEQILSEKKPVREQIACLLDQAIRTILADADRKGCFMVNCTTELAGEEEEVSLISRENKQAFEARMAMLIEEGKQRGEITTKASAEALAGYLFTLWNGLQVVAKVESNPEHLYQVRDIALKALD